MAGNSFSAGVVAQMLDAPVLTLLGPLDECLGAGFLVAGDRPGDHRFSHALVRSAEAEQLGMVPVTEWIKQLRVRRPAAAAGGSPLSPRELEVARLVGRGLTNKQIGQTLYVSERTAENHVQHILTKLGLRNRSQIAAWASGEHDASRP